VREEANKFSSIPKKSDHHGLFASGSALLRLHSSFFTACFLLRQGLWLELACILKLILEQLAWSYAVRHLEGQQLFSTSPTASVGLLKKIYPSAGKMYGLLNGTAHISPEQTVEYLDFSESFPQVFLSSPKQSAKCAYFLLMLSDIYVICSEYVHTEYYSTFSSIIVEEGKFSGLIENRPYAEVVLNFRQQLMDAQRDTIRTSKGSKCRRK
jgi:hypothetical protein